MWIDRYIYQNFVLLSVLIYVAHFCWLRLGAIWQIGSPSHMLACGTTADMEKSLDWAVVSKDIPPTE